MDQQTLDVIAYHVRNCHYNEDDLMRRLDFVRDEMQTAKSAGKIPYLSELNGRGKVVYYPPGWPLLSLSWPRAIEFRLVKDATVALIMAVEFTLNRKVRRNEIPWQLLRQHWQDIAEMWDLA